MHHYCAACIKYGYCVMLYLEFLFSIALSMKALLCIVKNNIGIEVMIVTSIFEYDNIVYLYMHKVSKNFRSRCEVSDIYREE
jgi:hypothetical protein